MPKSTVFAIAAHDFPNVFDAWFRENRLLGQTPRPTPRPIPRPSPKPWPPRPVVQPANPIWQNLADAFEWLKDFVGDDAYKIDDPEPVPCATTDPFCA